MPQVPPAELPLPIAATFDARHIEKFPEMDSPIVTTESSNGGVLPESYPHLRTDSAFHDAFGNNDFSMAYIQELKQETRPQIGLMNPATPSTSPKPAVVGIGRPSISSVHQPELKLGLVERLEDIASQGEPEGRTDTPSPSSFHPLLHHSTPSLQHQSQEELEMAGPPGLVHNSPSNRHATSLHAATTSNGTMDRTDKSYISPITRYPSSTTASGQRSPNASKGLTIIPVPASTSPELEADDQPVTPRTMIATVRIHPPLPHNVILPPSLPLDAPSPTWKADFTVPAFEKSNSNSTSENTTRRHTHETSTFGELMQPDTSFFADKPPVHPTYHIDIHDPLPASSLDVPKHDSESKEQIMSKSKLRQMGPSADAQTSFISQPRSRATPSSNNSVAPSPTITSKNNNTSPVNNAESESESEKESSAKNSMTFNSTSTFDSKHTSFDSDPTSRCHKFLRWCNKAFSFSVLFSLLTAVMIIVSVFLCWYISFVNSKSIIEDLSIEVRASVFQTIYDTVEDSFRLAFFSLFTIRSTLSEIQLDEYEIVTSGETPGAMVSSYNDDLVSAFASLSLVGLLNPLAVSVGYVTGNDAIIQMTRTRHDFSAASGLLVDVSQSILVANGLSPANASVTPADIERFLATPIRNITIDGDSINYLAQSGVGDISQYDTIQNITKFLGSPLPYLADFASLQAEFNSTSYTLRTNNDLNLWSSPRLHEEEIQPGLKVNKSSIRLYSRLEDISVTGGATHAPLTFIEMDLRLFDSILSSLNLGYNGRAYIMLPNGTVAASSGDQLVNYKNTWTFPDLNIVEIMRECGLVVPVGTIPPSDPEDYPQELCVKKYNSGSSGYLLQAQILTANMPALPWSVVLVTQDSDFNGKFNDTTILIIWTTALVTFVAILIAVIAARKLTGPMVNIVNFFEKLIVISRTKKPETKRSELLKLHTDWCAATGAILPEPSFFTEGGFGLNTATRRNSALREAELQNRRAKSATCFKTREVYLMETSFGNMLTTMNSHDELTNINQAKRQFIRYIFHEVRVPFNALVLGVEQLQADLAPHAQTMPEAVETLSILSEQSEVVTHILNDVLSLQKIEDNALTLEYRVFDIERMIRSTLISFKISCAERNLRIKINLTNLANLATQRLLATGHFTDIAACEQVLRQEKLFTFGVHGDIHRLRQVLSNYVSNSIKFSPRGKAIRVTLAFDDFEFHSNFVTTLINGQYNAGTLKQLPNHWPTTQAVAQVTVKVMVSDQGQGIPKAHQANLFTTYTQINAGTIQKSRGTGLGLSLSKSIIELHKGNVSFESVEGQGSDFCFTVPLQVYLIANDSDCANTPMAVSDTPGFDSPKDLFVVGWNVRGHSSSRQLRGHQRSMTTSGNATPLRSARRSNHQSAKMFLSSQPFDLNHAASGHNADPNDSFESAEASVNRRPDRSPRITGNVLSIDSIPYNDRRASDSVAQATSPSTMEFSDHAHKLLHMPPTLSLPAPAAPEASLAANSSAESAPLHSSQSPATPSLLAVMTPAATPLTPQIPAPVVIPSSNPSSLAGYRVLVVEDSAPNRKLLVALLKRLKCSVSQAENGQECLDMFKPYFDAIKMNKEAGVAAAAIVPLPICPFDMILMDNSMPVLNGMSATRILREHGIQCAIVGVTGNALQEDIDSFMGAGANEILTKPVSSAKLQSTLTKYNGVQRVNSVSINSIQVDSQRDSSFAKLAAQDV